MSPLKNKFGQCDITEIYNIIKIGKYTWHNSIKILYDKYTSLFTL